MVWSADHFRDDMKKVVACACFAQTTFCSKMSVFILKLLKFVIFASQIDLLWTTTK